MAYFALRPWFMVTMIIVALTACQENKEAKASTPSQAEEKTQITEEIKETALKPEPEKKKSSIALLGQLHSDTVLRQVRLPRYDENFNPLSLLHADRMEVIKGDTIEARDVSLELYNENGDIQARTKVKRAIYKENDAILKAEEAVYISGKDFKASGAGMVYDINTGQGFIIGPASSLFYLKSDRDTAAPR